MRLKCLVTLIFASVTTMHPVWAQSPADAAASPQARFEQADSNQDGEISREEFTERRNARFGEFDADQSGTLSKDEFGTALEGTPGHRFRGMAFRRADKDGDKLVSQAEWDAMPVPAFDRLDDNGDGKLEAGEFQPR